MKEIFSQVDGKWKCDFEALAQKTSKMFAMLDVKNVFKQHKDHIKVIDVTEGEAYVNIVILVTGLCYELVFNKTNKESIVNWISSSAVERINQALLEQSKQKQQSKLKVCCVCGTDKDLYSQTSDTGEYYVKTYCGNCLPE